MIAYQAYNRMIAGDDGKPRLITEEEVRVRFRTYWQYEPETVIFTGGGILAGPLVHLRKENDPQDATFQPSLL